MEKYVFNEASKSKRKNLRLSAKNKIPKLRNQFSQFWNLEF
jgi:hypothetical protein